MLKESNRREDGTIYWWFIENPVARDTIMIGNKEETLANSIEEFGIQKYPNEEVYEMFRKVKVPFKQDTIWEFSNWEQVMRGEPDSIQVLIEKGNVREKFVIGKQGDKYTISKTKKEDLQETAIKSDLSFDEVRQYMEQQSIDISIDSSSIQDLQDIRNDIIKVEKWKKTINHEEQVYEELFQKFEGKKIGSIEDLKNIIKAKDKITEKIEKAEKETIKCADEKIFNRVERCLKGLSKERTFAGEGRE